MKKIFALAMGTFCFGMSEYIMMSILPDIAKGLGCSISQAGYMISAYSLGVAVGAPLTVIIARNYPLRKLLCVLAALMMIGNFLTALAPHYSIAMIARFLTGFPHGAYCSVAVVVSNKIAKEGKEATTVAWMMMGMTVANLIGIPLGNWLVMISSWRLVFLFNAVCGLVTLCALRIFIPYFDPLPKSNIKGQFRFLKHCEPWLVTFAAVLGSGGIYCYYSYINPIMTDLSCISPYYMPMLMFLSGGSMCIGNYLGGYFSDRWNPGIVTLYLEIVSFAALVLIYFLVPISVISVLLMCVCTACLFGFAAPIHQLQMKYAQGGELLGGALAQLSFNVGNSVGAYAGGIAIAAGCQMASIPIIGSVFVICGILASTWLLTKLAH